MLLTLAVCVIIGCHRSAEPLQIQEKKAPFQKTAFTDPKTGAKITLSSESECEIADKSGIVLAKYSKEGDTLRVVANSFGLDTVIYFDVTQEGLREQSKGDVFLLPDALERHGTKAVTSPSSTGKN